jgi:hypothetical protein
MIVQGRAGVVGRQAADKYRASAGRASPRRRPAHELASAAAILVIVVSAWVASAQAPIDAVQTWADPGTAGWTSGSAQSPVSNPGGFLAFTHAQQSIPMFAEDIARGAVAPGVRVTNISLRFAATVKAPSLVKVCLHAVKSGRVWYVPLSRPAGGEEKTYSVAVTRAAGWRAGPNTTDAMFDQDMPLVDWVGVLVRRNADTVAQEYRIDDLRLQGVYVEDLDGDGIPNAWEMSYGMDPESGANGAADPDGDGMSNYGEYRAGTRPDDAGSVFRVDINMTNAPGLGPRAALRWMSIPDRTYAVWAGESLEAPFARLQGGIAPTPGTNTYVDTGSTPTGPVYYHIEVEGQ